MTIRRRLTFSFLAILALFTLNLGLYFWGKQQQDAAVGALRTAVSRQILANSITQNLGDMQKQVALLSEVMAEAAESGARPEEIARFTARMQAVREQIAELARLSVPQERTRVEGLASQYGELSDSWRIFYENFGVNQSRAILELATRADPLSQRVVQQTLPQLQEGEKRQVEAAAANFERVGRLTERITLIIFIFSAGIAGLLAYRVSRYLTKGLSDLILNTALIGSGQLEHRIEIPGRDELGYLSRSFNEMAANLAEAHGELTRANQELEGRNKELEEQRRVSDSLLLNILPPQVATELKDRGQVEPKYFEDVTIIFTDFVGFTLSTEQLAAEDLVRILHDYFTGFDQIVSRYHMEKLKTIGDSYMYVGGMPVGRRARRNPSHPVDAVMAAFEMVKVVRDRDRPDSTVRWAVRVGVHTGPVIAGVVGIHKFAFDIWGDSVNYASRMESSGAPNRINLSERTYSRVKDFFACEHRGKVQTKEKREFDMYFAQGILPALLDGGASLPPEPFLRRYRVYFQKEPPAFPAFLQEPASASTAPASTD